MSTQITQSQYNVAKQPLRNLHVKLEILNFEYLPVDNIEGNVISGSIMIDANSDIRRTCNLSFVVTDSSLDVQAGGQIFLDKYIQIYTGVESLRTHEIVWNNMGIFLINQPTYNYDAETKTLSFDGVDLMAKLTGERNGYIKGLAGEDITLIETGQNIREIIIGILKENGFSKYIVSECLLDNGVVQDVPYDIDFGQGSTWYDVLSELRNILPQYQIYFDENGVFHYEKIPQSEEDPIMIDDDIWIENTFSETIMVNFEDVKNAIEVYGVTHDTQYFSDVETSTVSGNQINLIVDETFSEVEFLEVAFVIPENVSGNITVDVNGLGAKPLVNIYGNQVTSLEKDVYWVISFQSNDTWQFLGHLQAQGYWEDNNPDSPFYVNGSIGKILLPLYDGEYNNIQSDELALQRAKWEIYQRCRLNDTLRITTIPIYWADVNWKVRYTSQKDNKTKEYIVVSVETDLSESGEQTWELSSFYPFYPII